MTPFDVILLKIGEEAAEVAENASRLSKNVSKALRFGLDSHYQSLSNRQRLVEDYMALESELFDLRVALLIYTLYTAGYGEATPDEITLFDLNTFSEGDHPAIAQRVSRYMDTLDITLTRLGLAWHEADAFTRTLRALLAYVNGDAPAPTPEKPL